MLRTELEPQESLLLEVLQKIERILPELMSDKDDWKSMDIVYEKPRVERLWMPYGDYRVNLHCIHACKPDEALFHPHPWPSAMRVLGTYEMGVGYGAGETPPPVAARIMLAKDSTYEMTDPDAWHYVRPLEPVSFSLMVTGKPWNRPSPRSNKPPFPLSDKRRRILFTVFNEYYKLPERFKPHIISPG